MPDDPEDDAESADDGDVLSPNELDISDDESVVEIDDGRYVISPGGGPPSVSRSGDEPTSSADDTSTAEPEGEATAPDLERAEASEIDLDSVHDWLEAHLGDVDSKYAFDATAAIEGRVVQKSLYSNDVVTTFENLVVWYAHHAGGQTPVEDVLGILLMESSIPVRFPADSIRAYARSKGLTGDDSIDDLLGAISEAGGIDFPPGED